VVFHSSKKNQKNDKARDGLQRAAGRRICQDQDLGCGETHEKETKEAGLTLTKTGQGSSSKIRKTIPQPTKQNRAKAGTIRKNL